MSIEKVLEQQKRIAKKSGWLYNKLTPTLGPVPVEKVRKPVQGARDILPSLDGALKVLIDPALEMGNIWRNRSLVYGVNLLNNPDFHDFTFNVTTSLVAHWIFDSYYHTQEGTGKTIFQDLAGTHDLTPSSGFDYNNQLTGSNPAYKNGKALYFDKVDDFLKIPAASAGDFNPNTSDFSWSFWLKADAGGSGGYIVNKVGTARYSIRWVVSSGVGYIYVWLLDDNGNGLNGNWVVTCPIDGNYHHFVISVDRTNNVIKSYRDGNLGTTRDISTATVGVNPTGDLYIGTYTGTSAFLEGFISEMAYWNKALTQTEAIQLAGLAKGWTWDGVGSVSNDNFKQVVSGGGKVTQTVSTTFASLYEIKKSGVPASVEYSGQSSSTVVELTDGSYSLVQLREVKNVKAPGSSIIDWSGNGHLGTPKGSFETSQPVNPVYYSPDGIDDVVDFGTHSDFNVSDRPFIVGMWVSRGAGTSKPYAVGANHEIQITSSGEIQIYILGVTTAGWLATGVIVPLTGRHFILLVYDPKFGTRLYLNGDLVYTNTTYKGNATGTYRFVLFGYWTGSAYANYFTGDLGMFFMYHFNGNTKMSSNLPDNINEFARFLYEMTAWRCKNV